VVRLNGVTGVASAISGTSGRPQRLRETFEFSLPGPSQKKPTSATRPRHVTDEVRCSCHKARV